LFAEITVELIASILLFLIVIIFFVLRERKRERKQSSSRTAPEGGEEIIDLRPTDLLESCLAPESLVMLDLLLN
jgi:hypothetical protein